MGDSCVWNPTGVLLQARSRPAGLHGLPTGQPGPPLCLLPTHQPAEPGADTPLPNVLSKTLDHLKSRFFRLSKLSTPHLGPDYLSPFPAILPGPNPISVACSVSKVLTSCAHPLLTRAAFPSEPPDAAVRTAHRPPPRVRLQVPTRVMLPLPPRSALRFMHPRGQGLVLCLSGCLTAPREDLDTH